MKVAIIGTGMVGAHAAYALVLTRSASVVMLVDVHPALAQAHAEDIRHATPFAAPAQVNAGNYADIGGADVVLLCCGVGQRSGETRMELLARNAAIFQEVIPQVLRSAPDAILVVASNPVDVMTELVRRLAHLPEGRVLSSGTMLDTARFRTLIGEHVGVSPLSVHGYVLGEHGDSEVLAWSTVDIAGIPLEACAHQADVAFDDEARSRIDAGVRRAADRIIAGKGYTAQDIGAALARVVRIIRDNERAVLTLSGPVLFDGATVTMSMPRILGRDGSSAAPGAIASAGRDASPPGQCRDCPRSDRPPGHPSPCKCVRESGGQIRLPVHSARITKVRPAGGQRLQRPCAPGVNGPAEFLSIQGLQIKSFTPTSASSAAACAS